MTRAYYADLYDFAYAYVGSPETAADLVQDVLLNVWERRRRWQPRRSARAYLFGAVRNRALNHLRDRKKRAHVSISSVDNLLPSDSTPEDEARYRELLADYRAAVEELPERRRLVFRLSRLYGLTYAEIADALGISVNTVRSQMAAALDHLRARLGKHFT